MLTALLSLQVLESVGLTHWGRVTHICVIELTIIGSDNGLSPGQHQAIIWTNAEMDFTDNKAGRTNLLFQYD